MTEVLLFSTPMSVYIKDKLGPNTLVVVNLDGSLELGLTKQYKKVNDNIMLADLIRLATAEDKATHCDNCKYARSLLAEIKQDAEKLKLDMKVGNISTNLDKSKIIVNYTAEERVDFRELLRILGGKFHARIEMKQIGNRDETKMIGALGVCGRETCCKAFLSDFDKISVKMAKNQNISPNPTKINGMCGRLLCCLKYEDEFYAKMQERMPKINSMIKTPNGQGKVMSTDFLKETVTVSFTKDETTEVKIYTLEELKR